MFPPKKILFPVDFSERCDSAARMVETFTGHFEAELTLAYVLEPRTYNDIIVDAAGISEQQLGAYLADELKPFEVRRVMLDGDPARAITHYAHSRGFDLIMLPTHGYGAFRRLILGSVTAKILHEALCPVWTGVHMEQVPRLEDIAMRKIVCAVDLGKQSCPTLSWAARFAAEFGAELVVVHAVPEEPEPGEGAERFQEELILDASRKIAGMQESLGSEGKALVVAGDAAATVCACAGQEKADLLVIGRSVTGGLIGRLRENAYSIIRQSPCPVVSV
jgi:nucleotide-binding universal stress UspA family protein